MSGIHVCTASDMHPYNCDGLGKCVHCDSQERLVKGHKRRRCWLCWDGDPEGPPGVLGGRWLKRRPSASGADPERKAPDAVV